MREKYVFLIGVGTGLVLTAILALFLHNISKNTDIDKSFIIETFTEQTSEQISEQTSDTTQTTTINKSLDITTKNPMEITTNKSIEFTTIKPIEFTTKSFELTTKSND